MTQQPEGTGAEPGSPPLGPPPGPGRWERARDWWSGPPPRTRRERARARAIRRGVVAGTVLLLVGSVVRLPLLVLSPGPTYNTIGTVDGTPMIVIKGTTTYPTEGALDMTTVAERGGSSDGVHLGEAVVGWFSPSDTLMPREALYGPDTTGDQVQRRNDQLFALSQSDSIAAAMGELDIPTTQAVVVTMVSGGSPADGIVRAGDIIVAVNGTKVSAPADVGRAVRSTGIGQTVVLEVLRAEGESGRRTEQRLEVVTEANPALAAHDPAAQVPYIGNVVGLQYEAPFDIEFTLDNVGGPSAGMMFSLAMVDMLTSGALTGGGHVAGTGTIDPGGAVGPIGGIRQKLLGARSAGATLFLAPKDNCDEVVGHEPEGMTVVPIATLGEARSTVERWAADSGAAFPTCAATLGSTGG